MCFLKITLLVVVIFFTGLDVDKGLEGFFTICLTDETCLFDDFDLHEHAIIKSFYINSYFLVLILIKCIFEFVQNKIYIKYV